MKSLLLACVALSCLALSAQAHEIWIERDKGTGPVRVYFGEPAEKTPNPAEDELGRLKHFEIVGTQGKAGSATRHGDHLVAPLQSEGDAWLFDNQVFEPWQGEDKRYEAVSYYARAGRDNTVGRQVLELVPTRKDGDTLTVMFRNQPLAGAEVAVFDANKQQQTLKSDAKGQVTLPKLAAGRHLVTVSHPEQVQKQIAGKPVAVMHHISTLTFAVE